MDKYDKRRFFIALVLEMRASLYSTPSDAIFTGKFRPFPVWITPAPPTPTHYKRLGNWSAFFLDPHLGLVAVQWRFNFISYHSFGFGIHQHGQRELFRVH